MIGDRILQFIRYKGINKSTFYKEVGLSNGFLDKATKNIGTSKIEQMLKAYPEINPDWFLTGEGNMLKSDVHTTGIKESKKPYSIEDRDKILEDIEKRYQEYKEMCDQLVLSYKERIIEMKEEIIFLREQLNK
ncbi:peptidase S24 [Elizabethkingia anophelis]|uniref:peptidase S24 n=1 Tax=Elizabethkingia anophelis TaxID=1117645 RepID=UPI001DFABD1C|nr:peptidase S24 [Elizabethkingia anophelis]EHM7979745.1 peptidase S24 [Elizabethkingia anophelis]EHM8030887.1 peptidase S24 [Elizabethkingia anophelis]EHZ9533819.1 peptidase S24 [Elizabethkingia anophelis]EKU3671730.1 peptidase S24 [Elizabethkingia anophelis]EKU4208703.1 peptidase S24 [Elizabethkingia anophelis]